MSTPVYNTLKPIRRDSLRSGPVACPARAETSLVKIFTDNGYYCRITSRAYWVNGAPSKACQFRIYAGGTLISFYDQNRNTGLGQVGTPVQEDEPIPVPPNCDVEVRFYNADAVQYDDVESDGQISYFRDKP